MDENQVIELFNLQNSSNQGPMVGIILHCIQVPTAHPGHGYFLINAHHNLCPPPTTTNQGLLIAP